jgi:hypothetical protein
MRAPLVAAITLGLGVAGCAAYGGAILVQVPIRSSATRGATVASAVALETTIGTRFHGTVCRDPLAPPPTHLHIDHMSSGGVVLASDTRRLSGLEGRNTRCAVYDVATNWKGAPTESVSVCALRSDALCPKAE